MKKKVVIAACFLFLFSRIFFINTQPIFFDAAEYLKALAIPNVFKSMIAVHFPLHDGFFLIFWPLYHTARFFHQDPVLTVILGEIILAGVTVYFFYNILAFIADKRIALIATIIISLSPLFWISNVTILYEIAYVFLFFASLYFLTQYLVKKKTYFLHLSALFLPLAFFTHMMVVLWVPLYLAIAFLKGKEKFKRIFIVVIIYILVLTIIRTVVVNFLTYNDLLYTITYLYFGNSNNAPLVLSLHGMLVYARNFLITIMRGYTSLVALLSLLSLALLLFKKDKSYFIYGLLWIAPAVLALQFWEAQLPGRYAILAGFGIAFLAAYFVRNSIMFTGFLILYMLFVSLPAMNLLRSEIPYLKLAEYTKTLPKDSLLIESHFSRPQVQDVYEGKLLTVNEPGIGNEIIQKNIDEYLKNKKDVFISSAALTDPYGLYTGPYLHILSLSYAKPPELKSVIEKYTLKEYKVITAEDNLIMYKVVSNKKHPYPQMKSLKDSHRRIDYYDPLWRMYKLF